MSIEFTGQYRWASDGWLSFRAIVDGKSVTNRIAKDALQDHFDSDGSRGGDEAGYLQFHDRIEQIAEWMIAAGNTNAFGGADLTSDMVQKFDDLAE